MTGFIIMTAVALAFGSLLFYSVLSTALPNKMPDETVIKKHLQQVGTPVFPSKCEGTVLVTDDVLDFVKSTDGYDLLLPYAGKILVCRIYLLENSSAHIAAVFIDNNAIVGVFLSRKDLIQFVKL